MIYCLSGRRYHVSVQKIVTGDAQDIEPKQHKEESKSSASITNAIDYRLKPHSRLLHKSMHKARIRKNQKRIHDIMWRDLTLTQMA